MFSVNDFLDRAKKAAGVDTDYALALKVLGHRTQSRISSWRHGVIPDDDAALALCRLTGDDPEDVLVRLQSMRVANDPDVSAVWEKIAERLRKGGIANVAAMTVLATVFAAAQISPVEASPALLSDGARLLRIMSNVILARIAWRLWLLARNRSRTQGAVPA